jgi:hypothetical protein
MAAKILIAGASGLIGSHLVPRLRAAGHDVIRLVRRAPAADSGEFGWNPAAGQLDAAALPDIDAVINLAGEGIADHAWSTQRKQAILASRVESTRLLAGTVVRLSPRPQLLIQASAVGYYGSRGDEELDESSPPGRGFLPEVCQQWEDAARTAAAAGVRVVWLRIGLVLARDGGALAKMLTPFSMGAGGRIGSGRQYMSWIALEDLLRVIDFALATESLSGPLNATSPNPVTNAEFTHALGHALHRPTFMHVPAFAIKLALGEMGERLLLEGARVLPRKLLAAGFEFRYPTLAEALRFELARAAS